MRQKRNGWKYILGEILIVTVGILIAFGINTTYSELQKGKIKKEYTESLVQDLESNLKYLNRVIDAQEKKVQNLNYVRQSLQSTTIDFDSLGVILYTERKSPTFFPVNGTFKSLISHGDIQLFDTNIKRKLFNLYDTTYERDVYNGRLYDQHYGNIYDKQLLPAINLSTRKIDDSNVVQSKLYLKNLSTIIDEASSYTKLANKSKESTIELLSLFKNRIAK